MRVYIAMGSNIDPRLDHLKKAKHALSTLDAGKNSLLCAPLYRSTPVNCPPGAGEFINTVISLEWQGNDPVALLDELQNIERSLGRDRSQENTTNAPRTIDLDLLFTDSGIFENPRLILPHPRLHLRRFVLQPLADIAGEVTIPPHKSTVNELLASLDSGEPALSMMARHW